MYRYKVYIAINYATNIILHSYSHQLHELGIIPLKYAQLFGYRYTHAAITCLLVVKRLFKTVVLAVDIGVRKPQIRLPAGSWLSVD